jgi:hypothetical protein
MNKKNVAVTAAVLAAIITGLFFLFPGLNRSPIMDVVYFPAVLLTVIFSSDSHSPSAIAGWSAFLSYTLVYLVAFVVLYAFLAELYLIRTARVAVNHSTRTAYALRATEGDNVTEYLRGLGKAVAELETRRRRNFLLDKIDDLDLAQPPAVLGAQAIMTSENKRPIKHLLKELESQLTRSEGAAQAQVTMDRIREAARDIAKNPGAGYSS